MSTILLLDKSGKVTTKEIKNDDRLFAACHYRNEDGFEELHRWPHHGGVLSLYGKRKGKTPYENHSILPEPVHQSLFYGTLCLVKRSPELVSFTEDEWSHFTTDDLKPEEKELKKEAYEPEP
jgi:hypothetical protein